MSGTLAGSSAFDEKRLGPRTIALIKELSFPPAVVLQNSPRASGSTPLECKTRRLAVRDNEPFKVSQRGARPVVSQPSPYADAEPRLACMAGLRCNGNHLTRALQESGARWARPPPPPPSRQKNVSKAPGAVEACVRLAGISPTGFEIHAPDEVD
uniref:Uncharacterized protein n=1 Tax=Anopheles merus TaxID=30066 RepID=A0A182UT66_ANOME